MHETSPDFARAWQRFQALDCLRLAQDTLESEWTRGRTDYLAFLVPVADPAAQDHIARTIEGICGIAGVEAYPPSYWHITVKGAGFQVDSPALDDDVAASAIDGIIARARAIFAAEPPFDIRIGLANGFPEVVFLEVSDGGRVRALNSRLLQEVAGLARYPIDGRGFLPHISIARFISSDGLPQLKQALAQLRRGAGGPTFRVREVQLIRARLSGRRPPVWAETVPSFDLVASFQLRG
ncbi:MAG: 2'-5' RNA ligase family protein [Dehalococcoidia bacterium]|nr:2'-5' RNA ligase family protein [Dehalococcoidia bacterium]